MSIATSSRFVAACTAILIAATGCTTESASSLIASGNSFYGKGDFGAAAIQYKSALQRDPQSAEARRRLGDALFRAGDIDGALVELTKVVKDPVEGPIVLPTLSSAMVQAGEFKKLVSDFGSTSLEKKEAQAELKTNLAIAWGALRDVAKAKQSLDAAFAAVPEFGPAMVVRSRLLAAERKPDEAIALLDSAVAKNPKAQEAWLVRGQLLEAVKGDVAGAEASYKKALEAAPNYVQAHSALVMIHIRRGDMASAKQQAKSLVAVAPNHPYTQLLKAQIAFAEQRFAEARETLQALLKAFPDSPSILLLSGAVEVHFGALTQAASQLSKALRMDPGLDAARRTLAEIEVRQGQSAQALSTLKPLLEAPAVGAETYSIAADAELRQGRAAAAEKYYLLAAKADPSNLRVQSAAALARIAKGDATAAITDLQNISGKSKGTFADEMLFAISMRKRDFTSALATLDTMEKKAPGKAALLELRGQVHLARGDQAAARAAFEQAAKSDPSLFAATRSLVRIDTAQGKLKEATARLDELTKQQPENASAWLLLAELKAQPSNGSAAEIKAAYTAAINAAPTLALARLQYIAHALRSNQLKDALAAAQAAAAALPSEVQVLDALGQVQTRTGDYEQAAKTFRQLASMLPNSPDPYMRLAGLYNTMGKRDQAESALKLALEGNPNFGPAQTALVELMLSGGKQREALAHITQIKEARPTQALGYALEAGYHTRQKKPEAAIAVLRQGVAKSGSRDLASKLAVALIQSGKDAEAEAFGLAWLKDHPDDASMEYVLAERAMVRNDFKSAEVRLSRVLAIQKDNVAALNNLAWLMATNGRSGASALAQRALYIAPDDPGLLDTFAFALASEKKFTEALEVQKRAVELSPGEGRLRLGLAKIALQAGDKGLAKSELTRLADLGASFPDQAEVKKLLSSL